MSHVGVLALQGSSEPHLEMLHAMGETPIAVRRRAQMDQVTHLILPGGESTTIHHLLDLFDMLDPLVERTRQGSLALFGTCAGAILVGRDDGTRPPRLGLLDAEVTRNAYGRQVDSFSDDVSLHGFEGAPTMRGVFIRAPRFGALGPAVQVLARHREEPVLVHHGAVMAATFHPELGDDPRIHARFLASTPQKVQVHGA